MRQLAVGQDLAAGDLAQLLPHGALELGAGSHHRQPIDNAQFTGEIALHGVGQPAGIALFAQGEAIGAVVGIQQLHEARFVIGPVNRPQAPLFIGNQHQFTHRRSGTINQKSLHLDHSSV